MERLVDDVSDLGASTMESCFARTFVTCWRRNEGNSVERSTTEDVGPVPRSCKRKRRGWQGGNPAPECVRIPKLNLKKVRWDQTPQQQNGRWEQSGGPTEFTSVFCADSGDDSISESGSFVWFALVDEMCNAGPALALAGGLGDVLRKALWEVDGGRLEVLDGVCAQGRVGIR